MSRDTLRCEVRSLYPARPPLLQTMRDVCLPLESNHRTQYPTWAAESKHAHGTHVPCGWIFPNSLLPTQGHEACRFVLQTRRRRGLGRKERSTHVSLLRNLRSAAPINALITSKCARFSLKEAQNPSNALIRLCCFITQNLF